MATFLCGGCGYEKLTSDSHIGRTAKCPKCKQSSVVHDVVESPSAWDAEEEAPLPLPPPIQVVPAKGMPLWATIILVLTWLCLGIVILVSAVPYITASLSDDALRQSAVTAVLVTRLVGGYIIARCVEKIVKAIAR